MRIADLKRAASVSDPILRRVFLERLLQPYSILPIDEPPQGQYWSVLCSALHGDDRLLARPLFYVQTATARLWGPNAVNAFFMDDDDLFAELYSAAEDGVFDELCGALIQVGEFEPDEQFLPTEISIDAYSGAPSPTHPQLFHEMVAGIQFSRSGPYVSCGQFERHWLLTSTDAGRIYYNVPFDKVALFPGAIRVAEPGDDPTIAPAVQEDENYVFVVMSFADDPGLKDAYAAIGRAAKRWNRKCNVQRIDQIEDDFNITDRILECIERASIVIADVTGERPNVYYELGYARGRNKRIVQLAHQKAPLHFDVKDVNTIIYDSATTLEDRLLRRLKAMAKRENSPRPPGK